MNVGENKMTWHKDLGKTEQELLESAVDEEVLRSKGFRKVGSKGIMYRELHGKMIEFVELQARQGMYLFNREYSVSKSEVEME